MFQLKLIFAPLWRMGPRCSSTETQVCHRSYIIATRIVCVAKLSSSLLSVKQFTIGVEFEVNIKTWDRGSYFCRFLYLKSFGVYYWYTASKIWIINWHNIINIPESKIKGFSFYIFLSLIDVLETLSHRSKEKIGKERCKVFPYRDVDDLLNN